MADVTQRLDYPALLDFPAPQVRSYPPATVIAEKFQAMVALGVLNGRMKDYYDLWAIPRAIDICLRRIARTRRCFAGIDH
ncbi:nucleotidyl transferase AbiEii/AbiGii toxin family protein [Agrobacterium sp. 22-3674b3]